MKKSIRNLKKFKGAERCLVLGHNALDYKSVEKYPFNYETKRGLHPPAPTTLLFDDWEKFEGDIITCHFKNYNSKFVVATEDSPRFHASGGIKVTNCPAYNKHDKKKLKQMVEFGLNPDDYYYVDIPKIFEYKEKAVMLYTGLFALLFSCMMGYREIYTAGLDGTILGHKDGLIATKEQINDMKEFVRNGSHEKVSIFKNEKPKTAAEWSDWKVYNNYNERLNLALDYCNEMYPESIIYKSHKLSKLNTKIKLPL